MTTGKMDSIMDSKVKIFLTFKLLLPIEDMHLPDPGQHSNERP